MPTPASPELPSVDTSAALPQIGGTRPISGRIIGIVAGPASDPGSVAAAISGIVDLGMVPLVIAKAGGMLWAGTPDEQVIQRTYLTTRSVEFDAIIVADGAEVGMKATVLLQEAFRHGKAIGGLGSVAAVGASGIDPAASGMVSVLLVTHRVWERLVATA